MLKVSGYGDKSEGLLTFPEGSVSIGNKGLMFRLVQRFRTVPVEHDGSLFKVTTTYYSHAIESESGEEIIGCHWHPQSISNIGWPHLHLGAGARVGRAELESTKAHLPTGRVGIEDVVHLLIETFQVGHRRPDWKTILTGNLKRFLSNATWGRRH